MEQEIIKKAIKEIVEARIKKDGIDMSKKIQSAHYGFFFSSDSVYDQRIARSWEEVCKLNEEGFRVDDDMGIHLLNAFMD